MGGHLDARRATTALFAIENRTAYLKQQSYLLTNWVITAQNAEVAEHEFLQSLAKGRDLSGQVSIQDMERYALEWADLVPENANISAAIFHVLAKKYSFSYHFVPNLREALQLDEVPVKRAYQNLYQVPLESLYQPSLGIGERLRWRWTRIAAWLENLPPFWAAFSFTLTEIIGASILALPIALAEIGPIAGIVQLILLGIVNILTIAALVEAISRNGNMRYGFSYFGRMVSDFLGNTGSIIFTLVLITLNIFTLMAFYIGVATTLGDATKIPDGIWVVFLFLVGIFFLRRKSLDATIAFALVVGLINIGLIITLSLVTLPSITPANLLRVNLPLLNGQAFNPGILELVFGVILMAYFGHTSAANTAKVVLQRDPTGRSLFWGNVAAIGFAILLSTIWVLVVNGVIPVEILANTTGTALTPLAAIVGPIVLILGSIYVVLSMGMGSIHISLGIYNQVQERLDQISQILRQRGSSRDPAEKPSGWQYTENGKFIIALIPIFLVFIVVEWVLWNGQESFAGLISFIGVVAIPLLAGIFPMLMLVASRRKGEYVPGVVWKLLGNPIIVLAIYFLFLSSILLYGLVIWENPIQRAGALLAAFVTVVSSMLFIWQGIYKPRYVVELRVVSNRARLAFTESGYNAAPSSRLRYGQQDEITLHGEGEIPRFLDLQRVEVNLAHINSREVKIWVHQITPEGISLPLPGKITLKTDLVSQEYDLEQMGGEVIAPLASDSCLVIIALN